MEALGGLSPLPCPRTPCPSLTVKTARSVRREPRLRLPQRLGRDRRLGRRSAGLRLFETDGLHRGDGPLYAAGLEGDEAGGLCGGGLRVQQGRGPGSERCLGAVSLRAGLVCRVRVYAAGECDGRGAGPGRREWVVHGQCAAFEYVLGAVDDGDGDGSSGYDDGE